MISFFGYLLIWWLIKKIRNKLCPIPRVFLQNLFTNVQIYHLVGIVGILKIEYQVTNSYILSNCCQGVEKLVLPLSSPKIDQFHTNVAMLEKGVNMESRKISTFCFTVIVLFNQIIHFFFLWIGNSFSIRFMPKPAFRITVNLPKIAILRGCHNPRNVHFNPFMMGTCT